MKPSTSSLSIEKVAGRVIHLPGDDIDTDRIIPARFLRCVTFAGLEAHIFEDDRKADPRHAFGDPRNEGASILLAHRNFGCGSSREHAPQGLQRWGIRGIVAESFAEIFFGNCAALGVPCLTLPAASIRELEQVLASDPRTEVVLDIRSRQVAAPGLARTWAAGIPDGVRESFLGGTWDATGLLLRDPAQVEAVAHALPYVRGF